LDGFLPDIHGFQIHNTLQDTATLFFKVIKERGQTQFTGYDMENNSTPAHLTFTGICSDAYFKRAALIKAFDLGMYFRNQLKGSGSD
jgi:hypothetical protein